MSPRNCWLAPVMAIFSSTGRFSAWGGEAEKQKGLRRGYLEHCAAGKDKERTILWILAHTRSQVSNYITLGFSASPSGLALTAAGFLSAAPPPSLPRVTSHHVFLLSGSAFPPASPNYWSNNSNHRELLHKMVHFNVYFM